MERGLESDLHARLAAAEELNQQLRQALESRVVIEQAKGVLRERLGLSIDDAFELLRYSARSSRTSLRRLAARVVEESGTPNPVIVALARQSRWRAALMRERDEARRAGMDELHARVAAQMSRLAHHGAAPERPLETMSEVELDVRRARAAENESRYRLVNEAIEQAHLAGSDSSTGELICECARGDCTARIELRLDEYERVRSVPTHFVVMPAHHEPAFENIIAKMDDHWVVSKLGAGAQVARSLDPRRPARGRARRRSSAAR
jgi:hypothetical protein